MAEPKIASSTFEALRQLANRWTLKAREFARDSKTDNPADPIAAYNRGLAEGYYKSAVELAEVLKEHQSGAPASAPAPAAAPPAPKAAAPAPAPKPAAPPPQPAPPSETYLPVLYNEMLQILEYSGTNPREVTMNKFNVFTAIFSKWENLMPHERIDLLKKADMRIIVLNSGKTKDTNDPYIDFAFKEVEVPAPSEEPQEPEA